MSGWGTHSGRISRRTLIRTGAAASVLAATGFGSAAAPRQGGTLRIAAPGPAGSAPWGKGDLFGRVIAPGSVFDCLTEVGPDGQLRGELAESWLARKGAQIWEFSLRAGVHFHNGEALVAGDVVESLRPHLGPRGVLANVARLRETGIGTIQIRLRSADPQFPFILAHPSLVIRPRAADPKSIIGTGLYRVSEFVSGEMARLDRVVGHYRDGQGGWFDAVELLHIGRPDGRLEALQNGRVDVAADIEPNRMPEISRSCTVHVAGDRLVTFETRGPKADALRDALKLGLDRKALGDFISGSGAIENAISNYRAARDVLNRSAMEQINVALAPVTDEWPGAGRVLQSIWAFAGATGISVEPASTRAQLVVSTSLAPEFEEGPRPNLSVDVPVFWGFSGRLGQIGSTSKDATIDGGRTAERWFFT